MSGEPRTLTMTLTVPDMGCAACAATIKRAIETRVPSAQASADPATKRVAVSGAADRGAVEAAIRAAGYTPKPA